MRFGARQPPRPEPPSNLISTFYLYFVLLTSYSPTGACLGLCRVPLARVAPWGVEAAEVPCGRSWAALGDGVPDGTPDAEAEAPDDRPGAAEVVACAPNAAEEVEAGVVAEGPVRCRIARLP